MNQLLALSISIGVSLFVSTLIAAVLTEPLRVILKQLCLNGDASTFWIPFTRLMFYVTPLLFTMVSEGTVVPADLVGIVRAALASSLFGNFAALLVVGYQIARARPSLRQE